MVKGPGQKIFDLEIEEYIVPAKCGECIDYMILCIIGENNYHDSFPLMDDYWYYEYANLSMGMPCDSADDLLRKSYLDNLKIEKNLNFILENEQVFGISDTNLEKADSFIRQIIYGYLPVPATVDQKTEGRQKRITLADSGKLKLYINSATDIIISLKNNWNVRYYWHMGSVLSVTFKRIEFSGQIKRQINIKIIYGEDFNYYPMW